MKQKNIWMLIDLNHDELPIEVADTARELAQICGVKEESIIQSVSRAKRMGIRCRYVKVVDEE